MRHTHEQIVQIERSGQIYIGSFSVARKMLTVTYKSRSKKTQLGGSSGAPEPLARIMLRELVEDD